MLRTFDKSELVLKVPDDKTDVNQLANSLDKVKSVDLFFVQTIEKWFTYYKYKPLREMETLLRCLIMKIPSSVTWEALEAQVCSKVTTYRIIITSKTGRFASTPLSICVVRGLLSVLVKWGCKAKTVTGMDKIESLTKTKWSNQLQAASGYSVSSLRQMSLDIVSGRLQPGVHQQMLQEVGVPTTLIHDVRKEEKVRAIKREVEMQFEHDVEECELCFCIPS